ncbi:GNAT family N-acetyltransferase [Clostridium sp.]|uniref:GNAT family N-acetyltransferase n=1 Tax=Clostridium sp. TaxID=1506 RepID=UPI003217FF8D
MNTQVTIVGNFLDKEQYRKSFNNLAYKTFGLDFEDWYKKGYLKSGYIPYAIIDEDQVVSNISINKFEFVIEGELKKAIQIGTVMTDENFRNRGLCAILMKYVIDKYEKNYDLIYLFANNTVLDFYPKFGFERTLEKTYIIDGKYINKKISTIEKLDISNENHKELINILTANRFPTSKKLGAINDKWPLLVYCLYEFKDDLYYIPERDTIIILRREEETLHIYDIISNKLIDVDCLIESIFKEEEKVQVHFIPNTHKYKPIEGTLKNDDEALFILKGKNLLKEWLFPITSCT